MIQKQWYAIISFLCFASGVLYSQTFKKQPDGIVVELTKQKETDPQWMKIQFCTEDIVHVLASPTKSFSNRPSLMVDKANWKPVPFSIKEKSETIDISTSKIIVTVLLKTGAVAFRNANGQTLLQEKSGGGKIITPTTVMGEQTFHVQQLFNSQDDEAFYGLGGHQNSIMNLKDTMLISGSIIWLYRSHFLSPARTMEFSGIIPLIPNSATFGSTNRFQHSSCSVKTVSKGLSLLNILKMQNLILCSLSATSPGSSMNLLMSMMHSRQDLRIMSLPCAGVEKSRAR